MDEGRLDPQAENSKPAVDVSEHSSPGPADVVLGGSEPPVPEQGKSHSRARRWSGRACRWLAVVILLWLFMAYVALPMLWRHYEHSPGLEDAPKTTLTSAGIPGDPLNVGLLGPDQAVMHAMLESGWYPADPVTVRSSLRIAKSVLLDRPYVEAPVSPLFLFGRKQDLAFEKPVGANASRRHHVRFWKSPELGQQGKPLWIGAVTFDRSVGLSHDTGQITHHIGPDIDAERNGLFADLRRQGWLTQTFQVTGVGSTLLSFNGGGDPYYTDGELTIGVLATEQERDDSPDHLANPPAVQFKEQFWAAIRPLLHSLQGSQADE